MRHKPLFLLVMLTLLISLLLQGCLGEDTNILTFYTPTPTPDKQVKESTKEPVEGYFPKASVEIPVNSLNALLDENIPQGSSQVILVTVTEDGECLYCMESVDKGWKVAFGPFDCNIGRGGMGKQKEGDGKTPEGVFDLGSAFGQGGAPEGSTWPWRETDANDYWVEDSKSQYYNQYVNTESVEKDWNSADKLLIDKYRTALEVKYNPGNTPGLGSAIFLHVWGGEKVLTGGCTAMAQDSIETVLKWLRPEAQPKLFQTRYISQIPEGFCYIKDFAPEVVYDIRFATKNNILGKQANEYYSPVGIASVKMAKRLDKASILLKEQGLKLLVYDSYRPQTTVNAIVDWLDDESDDSMKDTLYPDMAKSEMIDMFFEAQSPYPRGGAVDASLVDMSGRELDMGSVYQYIDKSSEFEYEALTDEQLNNREILRDVMIQAGLTPNDTYWWSFYMEDEPFPERYFDFYVQ